MTQPETGAWVQCTPNPAEPEVTQRTHRAVCMLKKHPGCHGCPNSVFTLTFKSQQDRPRVACPKWESKELQESGESPTGYESTSITTCEKKPYPFCASCPSSAALNEMQTDKTKPGWYGRWKRFKEEIDDGG